MGLIFKLISLINFSWKTVFLPNKWGLYSNFFQGFNPPLASHPLYEKG